MAGKYIEIFNPGYSTLWTRDLPYTPGVGEAADLNPFDPMSARPLVEGEWLTEDELTTSGRKLKRGGVNVLTGGALAAEGTVPAYLYFQEQGRYDAQATKMAHIIRGPSLFEFRTKLAYDGGAPIAVHTKVSVWDWDGPAGVWGICRRVLAPWAAGYVIGRVTRVFGTNDFAVLFMPGTN
jgi:hypothetical protein